MNFKAAKDRETRQGLKLMSEFFRINNLILVGHFIFSLRNSSVCQSLQYIEMTGILLNQHLDKGIFLQYTFENSSIGQMSRLASWRIPVRVQIEMICFKKKKSHSEGKCIIFVARYTCEHPYTPLQINKTMHTNKKSKSFS